MPISNTSPRKNPEPESLPELIETGGALNIRYRGRLLYSERGPALFAERLAASMAQSAEPGRLYILASPGLWYGVASLLARLREDCSLLCVEADPRLADLSRRFLPEEIRRDRRLRFVETLDPESLGKEARDLGVFRRVRLLKFSGGAAFHEAEYRRAAEFLDGEYLAAWKNRASLMAMGRLWIRNSFENLAALEEIAPTPLPRLRGPGFVCGAGPSLESALPLLARLKNRAWILACDTALPPLLARGIMPDLVVCLEAQAHNLADFVPLGNRRISLVADLSSHPATFRALRGPKHLSLVRVHEGAFTDRLAALGLPALSLPPLGSVGVHALHLARRIATGSVFALGLDFAFEAGKTHARGTPTLLAEEYALTRLHRWPRQNAAAFRHGVRSVPACPGEAGGSTQEGRLLTDPVLSGYAALLAGESALPGPRIYDIRGRGLPIGAPRLNFEEVQALVRQEAPEKRKTGGTEGVLWPSEAGKGATFLAGELDRLTELEAGLKGRRLLGREELARRLEELDYLLWPLPDAERVRALPQDLLNRVLIETEYWIWKLGDIIAAAEEREG